MTLEDFLGRLGNVKRTGSGWMARCPAHQDDNASLSITTGKEARILLRCHAGCPVESIVSAFGLKMPDLFPSPAKANHDRKPRIVAMYDYQDESGKLLFQCVRFDPKDFRQRRPDPAKPGQWLWNLKETRRVLYRLPEVQTGLAAGRTIFIVEGEKDCDALAKAGFVATCNPMGAGKFLPEHTDTFQGAARVVVIADKDEPGRKHAQTVAVALRGAVKSVKLIELLNVNGNAVKDAADFLAAGGTANELQAIVRAAPEFTPAPVPQPSKAEQPTGERLPAQSGEATLVLLAALPPLEYERQREDAAKLLNCRASILDKLVNSKRTKATEALQGNAVKLPDVEPWPDAVNGADLLREIAERFACYVALPAGAADALALWCAHAHAFRAFLCSPRLNISSPEKGCGKTTLRDVVAEFVPRPLPTENLSLAVLFRVVAAQAPTILADEYDAWLRDNEELRGLLNAGHRRGATVLRCEGEGNEVRSFAAYAPAVLCGIGSLPGTLHDRSIVIRLERAKAGELRERFDSRRTEREQELCRKLTRWCVDNFARLETIDPWMPSNAFNRLADNWRPLFAVAELAGDAWPQRAAAAFAKLAGGDTDDQGIGAMLLADIWQAFADSRAERMFSKGLVETLCAMTDRPWPEAHRGKPITETWLARRLRAFGINPRTLRIDDDRAKGYILADFTGAFERYLPAERESKRDAVTNQAGIDESDFPSRDTETACHASETHETPFNIELSRWHGSPAPEGDVTANFPTGGNRETEYV